MAEVFEGELTGEHGFVRKIAIKRMLAQAAGDADAARRFLDEARIASRLHHANIVAVLDVGLLEDLPFQVLELVDGIDVGQLIKRAGGTLPIEIAMVIAGDVAHALAHAHTATDDRGVVLDIVHRDVKPANILVGWDGDVKLTDFGIALARGREARTEAGMVTGTLGFMSPEQRQGGHVDGSSDVYALALTLHAMICGASPLVDPRAEFLVVQGEALPLDPSIPDDVRRLIGDALAPDRLSRPNAETFADALGRALSVRLTSDRRSVLRTFLATFHGTKPKPGVLDQLLGLEVVEVDPATSAVPPRFELHHTDQTKPSKPQPRRSSRWLVGIAAIMAGGVGVAVWQLTSRDHVVALTADASRPGDARSVVVVAITTDAPDAVVVDAALPDASVHVHHGRDAAIVAPPPVGTGYLQVVGADAFGAKVLVDGVASGFVPNKIEIKRGHHVIVVEKRDGTRLSPKTVDITDLDTLVHPVRLEW
jgi:serine/threonine protein kinase